jgi:hypothetical protein
VAAFFASAMLCLSTTKETVVLMGYVDIKHHNRLSDPRSDEWPVPQSHHGKYEL